jgi:hypothetical protein
MRDKFSTTILDVPKRDCAIERVFYIYNGLVNSTKVIFYDPLTVVVRADFEGEITVVYEDGVVCKSSVIIHPWLSNLRDMLRMLNNEIKIPHKTYLDTDVLIIDLPCMTCTEAINLRRRYFDAKRVGIQ